MINEEKQKALEAALGAHQREAVGVHTGGRQSDDHIAGLHGGVVQDLALVHSANGKAGQVVLVLRVKTYSPLGSLAA